MEIKNPVFENIWLADDDEDDCELFEDVVKQILPLVKITLIPNGEVLLDLLGRGKNPDMLFLDLNMPCKDGLDCLVEIRARRQFSKLPVVVFTSSKEQRHVEASYGFGANLFYTKPASFQELITGLTILFKMNWSNPSLIRNSHYLNEQFVPFLANK